MGMKSCETFLDVDKLFINYKANEEQFNTSSGLYYQYCPVKNGLRTCGTDYEKLSAIFGYALMELAKNPKMDLYSEYDPSIAFLVMGWCHRLYKISKGHNLPLKHSLEKYLGKSTGNINYRGILNNKTYLMNSSIEIMNMFYLLFQQLCEIINTYETNKLQPYQYINSAAQFYIIYNKFSNLVNQCGPYLRLLNHLKTIYDEFINAVIKYNNHDQSLRSRLIGISSIDKTKFVSEFNSTGCKQVNQMLEKKISRLKNEAQEEQDELNALMELLVSDDADNGGDDEDADGVDAVDGGEKEGDTMKSIDNTTQNHGTDLGNSLDQSNESHDDQNQSQCDTKDNTDDLNGKKKSEHKPEQTLENSQSSDKSPENPSDEQLPKETTQENQDTTKESKDSTQEISLTKKESIVETLKFIKSPISLFKPNFLSFYSTLADIGNNSHEKTLQTLQNTSSKHSELANKFNNPISQPDKETVTPPSGDNKSMPKDSGSDPPSSDDPSVNHPPLLPNSQPEPEYHSNEDKEEPSNDEKTDEPSTTPQEPPIDFINTSYQVTKLDNSGNNINGIISENVNSMDILKKHKLIAFSVIGIAIPITLAIMYKYLSPWRTKKSKRKTKMKKIINLVEINKTKKTVINSINGKRPMQIIINSSTKKKQTKKFITSVYGKNFPLLNIYNLMQADPVPFINLFFLLIFFVYK
ncbi:CIR protein [Plasmodium chabaudi chabaudi]|uniref:CIR protein n=1 Tax=Plasmodium chabaudi chabaudi TaxID=31271 RepID=A0A4V0K3X1_PLACU|nr:CIR protein [Plasmodium chabaudi chabaudi]VTZ67608.1 CIR protein [Plasmodium chabaudi chabaudi]|eukprot:XP_016653373.1 CIR protein [Plasmodium chabaudi chabaudi]